MQAAAQVLSVSPGVQEIKVNTTTSVRLRIDSVMNLTKYSLTMRYDPSIVKLTTVTELNFLAAKYTTFFFNYIDSIKGTVKIDASILGSGSVSGSGTIAELKFRGKLQGTSVVAIIDTDVRNDANVTLPMIVSDGQIHVATVSTVQRNDAIITTDCLLTNFPNPFNPSTTVVFTNPRDQFATVSICTIQGQILEVLVSDFFRKGTYTLHWNGTHYSSGIYAAVVRTDHQSTYTKMILQK